MNTGKNNKTKEVWKSPPSLKLWWVEVSNLGRVRTLDHESTFVLNGVKATRKVYGRIKKLTKDTRGRFQTGISLEDGNRLLLVHRLVAECFVKNPKPNEFDMVFFKNKDITDCRAENLEWGCRRDRDEMTRGAHNVLKLRLKSGDELFNQVFRGCGELARALGVSRQAVHSAIMKNHLCKGYYIIAEKDDGDGCVKTIDQVRIERMNGEHLFCPIDFDIKHYKKKDIDILPNAVFK